MNIWLIRAGDNNSLIDDFNDKSIVAIGWGKMGDLGSLERREEFKQKYTETYGESKSLNAQYGQIYRFYKEIKIDDIILTYNQSAREYSVGCALTKATYDNSLFSTTGDNGFSHIIKMEWKKKISRDQFSASAKKSLGTVLTVSRLNKHRLEIEAILNDQPLSAGEDESGEEEISLYDEVAGKAEELIADKVDALDGYEFQDLFAAILRAMGFKAKSSPPGPDGGIDIVAHPDEFGFENPIVKVQVKHKKGSVGGPDMRNFMAVLENDENGIFVSSSGFTPDAKNEAKRYKARIKLMDRGDVIKLMLANYEKLEAEFKSLVPLKMLWLPYSI